MNRFLEELSLTITCIGFGVTTYFAMDFTKYHMAEKKKNEQLLKNIDDLNTVLHNKSQIAKDMKYTINYYKLPIKTYPRNT